jgi:hypothetical protein
MTAFRALEQLVAEDRGNRGIGGMVQPGHLRAAADALLARDACVAIVSGFYIPKAGAGETDGPPGAKALGDALTALGAKVVYLTDRHNAPLFQALRAAPLYTSWAALRAACRPTHLLAVERAGRALDGCYYNLRAEDISAHTDPLDEPFLAAAAAGMVTIGIGDGGNEIGMGRVREHVARQVPQGERIGSTVETAHLIVSGVSNWGAYGLCGALSALTGRNLLPGAEAATDAVRRIVAAGAVDGLTHRNDPTVDALPLAESLALLARIGQVLGGARAAGQ